MSASSLYEKFLAVGAVKSLITGKEIAVSVSKTESDEEKQHPDPLRTENSASFSSD